MLKGYSYNEEYEIDTKKKTYSKEYKLIEEFENSEKRNIRFEYENNNQSSKAYNSIRTHILKNNKNLKIFVRGKFLFVEKIKNDI